MDAQELTDEVTQEEKRREVFKKINPATLERYSKLGIELVI